MFLIIIHIYCLLFKKSFILLKDPSNSHQQTPPSLKKLTVFWLKKKDK